MKGSIPAYILSIFLIGLGFIFITPPFEAFDENAHYSRIIETISNDYSPIQKKTRMDSRIENYEGPLPYGNGSLPFDNHLTYHKFFNAPYTENFIQKYKKNSFDFSYSEGSIYNWQYQHPPLYYMVMGIFLSPFDSLTLHNQINFLRVISFLIALISVSISVIAVQKISNISNGIIGYYFYPIIFPMFFIEFSRIGNDSLCFLINSIIFYYSIIWYKNRNNFSLLAISLLLGVGILVKAFFIPIFIALIIFVAFIEQTTLKNKSRTLKSMIYLTLPFLAFFILWSIFNSQFNKDMGLGSELNELMHYPILKILDNFSIQSFLRGLLVPIVTFSWSGTWSLTRLPVLMQLLFLIPSIYIAICILTYVNRQRIYSYHYLGILLLFFFYLALVAHVFISQILSGLGTSGGWYFHIFFPWIGLMLTDAIKPLFLNRARKLILSWVVRFSLLFIFIVTWFNLTLYAGCSIKDDSKHFNFSGQFFCLDKIPEIIQNNLILNHTLFGLFCIVFGYIILCYIIKNISIKQSI